MDIAHIVTKLGGVAPVRAVLAQGVSRAQISTALRRGEILRGRNGWLTLPTASPLTLMALRNHGFLTCTSFFEDRGLIRAGDSLHIRVHGPIPPIEAGVVCHRRRDAPTVRGGAVTVIEALRDALACLELDHAQALVDAAARASLVSSSGWDELSRTCVARGRRVIADRDPRSESALESIVRHRLKRARIPFEIQVAIGGYRADFVVAGRFVLETHGAEFHANQEAWERDRRRALELKSLGWDVIEVTYRQVMHEWPWVLEQLRRRMSTRRHRTLTG